VLPFIREPVLWPALIAILGHVVLVITLALLATVRTGSVVGTGLCGLISAGLVGYELRLFGRPRGVSVSVGLTWAAAIATTILSLKTGVL